MTAALRRLSALASQLAGLDSTDYVHRHNIHQLSPTHFLPRAAAIEPEAICVYHTTANGKIIRYTYAETSARAAGFAYYLKSKGLKRTGILATNTPAFLEAYFGISGAGGVNVAINYRLKHEDIEYIFDHADVDSILVDAEYEHLLDEFRKTHPKVEIIVDTDTDSDSGPYDKCVLEGMRIDKESGGKGWDGLETETHDEEGLFALSYTSGTTARPKGVEYTHRGCYVAALGNVIESLLNTQNSKAERCHYLWTLPMFHATGWTFPWAVTAVRGTHYTIRKIDYPEIWRLLKNEKISHYNAAPTVNTLLLADSNAERLPGECRLNRGCSQSRACTDESPLRRARPRNRSCKPSHRAPVRDDGEPQPHPSARLRAD
jgi:acyl-CoA synthetase (AMP-forming)/AMP-acid ligase II